MSRIRRLNLHVNLLTLRLNYGHPISHWNKRLLSISYNQKRRMRHTG